MKQFQRKRRRARPNVASRNRKASGARSSRTALPKRRRLDIVYKIPPGNTPDWYALDVLGHVLSNGVSSRLYQKFVKEKEIALSVYAEPNEQRGPSLFWFSLMARPETELGELEKLLNEEIARLQNELVAEWEMNKVQMQLRRERAQRLYSSRVARQFARPFRGLLSTTRN